MSLGWPAGSTSSPQHLVRTEATTAGTTWPIHYSSEVVEFINMVHRGQLAKIRLLTTWGQGARTSIAKEERTVIWTEDDIAAAITNEFLSTGSQFRSILVAPVAASGLVSTDLRRILSFVGGRPANPNQSIPRQPDTQAPSIDRRHLGGNQ